MAATSDVEPADLWALLQLHLDGDAEGIEVLLRQVDGFQLLAGMTGLLVALVGEDRLRELIAEWRAEGIVGPVL